MFTMKNQLLECLLHCSQTYHFIIEKEVLRTILLTSVQNALGKRHRVDTHYIVYSACFCTLPPSLPPHPQALLGTLGSGASTSLSVEHF